MEATTEQLTTYYQHKTKQQRAELEQLEKTYRNQPDAKLSGAIKAKKRKLTELEKVRRLLVSAGKSV